MVRWEGLMSAPIYIVQVAEEWRLCDAAVRDWERKYALEEALGSA
jgi:hypothetical protein